MKNPRAVSAVTHALSNQVYEHARQGRMVLTLGGDHSIAIGTIAGTARAVRERWLEGTLNKAAGDHASAGDGDGDGEIAVIWVDAHADINTPETSGSGNVHGMPVAWLTGLAQRSALNMNNGVNGGGEQQQQQQSEKKEDDDVFGWLNRDSQTSKKEVNGTTTSLDSSDHPHHPTGEQKKKKTGVLNLKKIVYIGLRDVDRGEKEILRREGIKAFSMHDIDK